MDPFLPPSPAETLLETIRQGYWDGASKNPLGTWVRNSGVTIGRAHVDDNSNRLTPELDALFKAWANVNPPPNRAAAIVAQHVHYLFFSSTRNNDTKALHHANLILTAFFFAMRPCEYSKVKERGCTKLTTLEDITFPSITRQTLDTNSILPHTDATYVTDTFCNKKNSELWQKRTHH
jgi:hypothetical protein